jgi:cytochrome c-type biogenesis protein CcmH
MSRVPKQALLSAALVLVVVILAVFWLRRPSETAATGPAPAASAPGFAASSAAPAPLSASQVEHGIGSALERTRQDPKDASAWAMLAHTYEMAGRFADAGQAYEKLLALRPKDAQVLADYADALGVVQRGSLQGEPAKMIARALALEPTHLKALVLGGKEAFERKRYAESVALWERALRATQDPAVRRPIETSIAEARAFMAPAAAPGASAPLNALAFISGRVVVAESLKSQIGPDDTVFVFARPLQGSRMPVALLRKKGSDLPLDFALDDTLAMVPQSRLSQQAEVTIGVRVSKRGDAIPVAGDLEGEVTPVKLGVTGLRLEISRVHP